MKSRFYKTGFTLIELLTVVGVLAILVGVLIPSISTVRRMAKETKQKAQFATIDMAILAFKNDHGDYPPADWWPMPGDWSNDYCGNQKLTEALLGWDLMGFHPDSAWRADGYDENGEEWTYDPDRIRDPIDESLHERVGPYLEKETANVFLLEDLYNNTDVLESDTYVICDCFGAKKVDILVNGNYVKSVYAGAPLLYYKANTSYKTIDNTYPISQRTYNAWDSHRFALIKEMNDQLDDPSIVHPLANDYSGNHTDFYDQILDPEASARIGLDIAYRPDSYILISAGMDGLYGTEDDIRNF